DHTPTRSPPPLFPYTTLFRSPGFEPDDAGSKVDLPPRESEDLAEPPPGQIQERDHGAQHRRQRVAHRPVLRLLEEALPHVVLLRSEEHTSELQYVAISYAVFC